MLTQRKNILLQEYCRAGKRLFKLSTQPLHFLHYKKICLEWLCKLGKSSLSISLCKLYYLGLNVLASVFSPSYPKSLSTVVGVAAEIHGWGRVEAVEKEASLRRGNYSLCSGFRYLPKWFSKQWVCYNAHYLIKHPPVLYSVPLCWFTRC